VIIYVADLELKMFVEIVVIVHLQK